MNVSGKYRDGEMDRRYRDGAVVGEVVGRCRDGVSWRTLQ